MNWQCPYCSCHSVLVPGTTEVVRDSYFIIPTNDLSSDETYRFLLYAIACSNKECQKLSLSAQLDVGERRVSTYSDRFQIKTTLNNWSLLPQGKFKEFPSYIPNSLLQDYKEACLIRELSPKASATLSRRCLQSMLKDFWDTKCKDLYGQIEEIKNQVNIDLWNAIDALRKVGNIGAHMKGDINLIVDIDDNEADQLIWLIETLFKEWYIARYERQERLKGLHDLGIKKSNKT